MEDEAEALQEEWLKTRVQEDKAFMSPWKSSVATSLRASVPGQLTEGTILFNLDLLLGDQLPSSVALGLLLVTRLYKLLSLTACL